ncbi:MAG: hypothetical protein ACYC1S_11385 [Gemmatimonadaceae bacterium]
MRSYLVSVRVPAMVAAFGAAALLSACEDKRVKEVTTGMSRDSVLTLLAQDRKQTRGVDSMPNVYVREAYFVNSKNYEVLFFDEQNKRAGQDTVPWKDLTPIVLIDNVTVGKGWGFWDSLSTELHIPLKKR